MYDLRSALAAIDKYFAWLERDHGYLLEQVNDHEIRLSSDRAYFRFLFSTDLPRFYHVKLNSEGVPLQRDLWELLAGERRQTISHCFRPTPKDASIFEQNEIMIAVFACALQAGGMDIVNGSIVKKPAS